MPTNEQLRRAAERCLAAPQCEDDAITARSLLESLSAGGEMSGAANIEAADVWHNKPAPLLHEFLRRYGGP